MYSGDKPQKVCPRGAPRVRIDVAKQGVTEFLDGLNPAVPIGLLTCVTGTGSTDEEKEAGCQDFTVLNALETGQIDALKQSINAIEPCGYTPIGSVLRAANAALSATGEKTIVLISDGIDTCAPPPACDVARELKTAGTDLVINTVGFKVDDEARAELQCIADVTGGSYAAANNAAKLTESLNRAAVRSVRIGDTDSTTIEGSVAQEDAPAVPAEVNIFSAHVLGEDKRGDGNRQVVE